MITLLKLENFRKHKSLEVNFTPGMNGIFGPNYTGKSTILYGILFALGGIKAVPCKAVVKSGCTTFSVEMDFLVDGEAYKVIRTKSTDRIFKGDEQIANGASVVNREVEKLLGMSIKRFSQIRYSRQKFTSALLTLGSTELHNILSDVSGADFVQTVLERLSDLRKKVEGQLDGRSVVDLTPLEAELAELGKEIETARQVKLSAEQDFAGASGKVTALKSRKKEAERIEEANRTILFQTNTLTGKQSQLTEELASLDVEGQRWEGEGEGKLEALETSLDCLRKEFKALKEARDRAVEHEKLIDRLEHQLEGLEELIDQAYGRLCDATDLFEASPGPSQELIDQSLKAATELESLNKVRVGYEVELGNLKKAADPDSRVCPSCHREYDDVRCLDDLHAQIAKVEGLLAEVADRVGIAELEVNQSSAVCRQEDEAFNKAAMAKESAQRDYDLGLSKRSELQTRLDSARLASADIKPAGDLAAEVEVKQVAGEKVSAEIRACEEFLRRLSKAQKSMASVKAELEALPELTPQSDSPAELEELLEVAEADLEVVRAKVAALSSTLSDMAARHRELDLTLERGKAENELASRLTSRLAAIKALHKFLYGSKDEYMREVWAALMADASQLVSQATAGALGSMERTEDGQFSYQEGEHSYAVSEASGAQQAIMGLAVQTALAKVLPPVFDVLLVDEPSADMDDEHSMTLSMLLPSRAAQVICVSHARMDSSTCANVIDLGT